MLIQKGTVIDGFSVIKLLGKGAMGAVYKAEDVNLGRIVALKILSPEVIKKPTIIERFKQETQVLAKMQHPAIVKIYTYGNVDNTYYFAQEYIKGEDLEVLLSNDKVFSELEVFEIARSIADAFAHYHPMGIVHRDLKPANIMRLESGAVKIMDFGLVRDDDQTRLTETGSIVGTLAYLSPELLEGADPDPGLDIYELGCILYELLTRKMLLNDKNFLRAGFVELRKRLRAIPDLSKDIDPRLYFVIKHCVHPDLSLRFTEGEQIIHVLDSSSAPEADVLPPTIHSTSEKDTKRLSPSSEPSNRSSSQVSKDNTPSPQGRKSHHSSRRDAASAPSDKTALAISKVSGSSQIQGIDPKKLRKIGIALTAMILSVFILFIILRQQPAASESGQQCFRQVNIKPSIDSAIVQWHGNIQHSYLWNLTPVSEIKENYQLVFNVKDTKSKTHTLHLDSLKPGIKYQLTLKSDDGTIFKRNVSTKPPVITENPLVTFYRGRNKKTTDYKLSVITDKKIPVELILNSNKNSKSRKSEKGTQHKFEITIPFPDNLQTPPDYTLAYGGHCLYKGILNQGPVNIFSTFRSNKILKEQKDRISEFKWVPKNEYTPCRITAGPSLWRNSILIGDKNGFVYSLSSENDKLEWAIRLPTDESGARFRTILFITSDSDSLIAVARTKTSIISFFLNTSYRKKLWENLIANSSKAPSVIADSKDWNKFDFAKGEFMNAQKYSWLAMSRCAPWKCDNEGNVYIWSNSSANANKKAAKLNGREIKTDKDGNKEPNRPILFCFNPKRDSIKWAYKYPAAMSAFSEIDFNDKFIFVKIRPYRKHERLIVLDKRKGREQLNLPLFVSGTSLKISPPVSLSGNRVVAGSGSKTFLINYDVEDISGKITGSNVSVFSTGGEHLGSIGVNNDNVCVLAEHTISISKNFGLEDLSLSLSILNVREENIKHLSTNIFSRNNLYDELRVQLLSPLFLNNKVYLCNGSQFTVLSALSNTITGQAPYLGRVNQPMLSHNGFIYFSSTDSHLYKFKVDNN